MPDPRHLFHRSWAVVALACLTLLGTGATNAHEHSPGPIWLGVLIAVGAILPALLNVRPAVALLTSGALTCAYFLGGYADGPIYLALPTVTYLVTVRTSPRQWAWPAAVAAVLAGAGLAARHPLWDAALDRSLWQGLVLFALAAASTATSAAVGSRRAAVAERARSTASEERLRMAADLHDGVGHGLAVIAMQAGAALHVLDTDPAAVRASLEAIRATSKESLDTLRSHLAQLSELHAGSGGSTGGGSGAGGSGAGAGARAGNAGAGSAGAGNGAGSAPRTPAPGLADVPALVDRVRSGGLQVGLDLRVGLDGEDPPPVPVGRAAYAVVQEGLTNVLRHAAATRAEVTVHRAGDQLVVTVTDDGRGAAGVPTGGPTQPGLGLVGMRSRVEKLGGTLQAGPVQAGERVGAAERPSGFRVRARIPVLAARMTA
jgi:signal transduction histidine kinase